MCCPPFLFQKDCPLWNSVLHHVTTTDHRLTGCVTWPCSTRQDYNSRKPMIPELDCMIETSTKNWRWMTIVLRRSKYNDRLRWSCLIEGSPHDHSHHPASPENQQCGNCTRKQHPDAVPNPGHCCKLVRS